LSGEDLPFLWIQGMVKEISIYYTEYPYENRYVSEVCAMDYNVWNAIAYEVTDWMIHADPRWEYNRIVKMIRSHSFVDWVEWRTERTMAKVDAQIEDLNLNEGMPDPITREFIKEDPETGTVIGYTLQISAPWHADKDN